jgi:hypothetical protein
MPWLAGKGEAMSLKNSVFYVGCAVAWFVLLPVLAVGGTIALFLYAVFAEIGAFLVGGTHDSLDHSTAREKAQQMCMGS